ncbi:hypothetical protein B566_EDAN010647 [Ephemera danica]|nr:hypothetical protein B566_EDAN010647 [Ephemera danica]
MKFLIVAALVAVCSAAPQNYFYSTPLAWGGYPYAFGAVKAIPYSAPVAIAAPVALASNRAEVRDIAGNVRGSYSYVDPNGKVNVVEYTAGQAGFRVLGANNLPVAPEVPAAPELKAPEPVQDTPEVVAARAEFARKFAEAEAGKTRRRRGLFYTAPALVPALAKTTVKVSQFEPVDAAVPASTRKIELTEKEHDVYTPYAAYAYPTFAHTVVAPTVKLVAEEKAPVEVKTIASPFVYNYGFTYPYVL